MFTDIGLHWGIRKCAAIHIKGVKLQNNESLPLAKYQYYDIPVIYQYYKYQYYNTWPNTSIKRR